MKNVVKLRMPMIESTIFSILSKINDLGGCSPLIPHSV